jgi:ABC-type sugar transport system permease subunit
VAPGQRKGRGRLREEFGNPDRRAAYYMILPSLLVILVVAFYPIAYALYSSFHKATLNSAGDFVGLQNYVLMFQNSDFIDGLKNTVVFTVVSVARGG